jgi:hypothetical protein
VTVEDPHLGDTGQPAAGEGKQGRRGGRWWSAGASARILVGNAAEQAAGKAGGTSPPGPPWAAAQMASRRFSRGASAMAMSVGSRLSVGRCYVDR